MSNATSKIKLLYVNHSMNMGGIETMILGFVDALPTNRYDVGVAVFEGGGSLDNAVLEKGSYLCDLRKKEGIDIGLIFRLRKLLKERKIDVVHTHNFSAWFYIVLATGLFMRDVTIVHTEHSLVEGHKKRRFLAERIFSQVTDHTVAVSEDVKQNMVDLCRIPPHRISVITNGIDTERFNSDQQTRFDIRRELGIDSDCFVIGTVGRLVPVKDHSTLIDAYYRLHNSYKKTKLLIVGDGPERDRLLDKIESMNLTKKVFLLGERKDIPGILSAFDLYVVSSLSEGFSISILEAMSSSLPLVATDVGGNSEIISQGVNGLLVPSSCPDQLCEAMEHLISDGELRYNTAKCNREKITRYFSMQSMMGRYQEMYQS